MQIYGLQKLSMVDFPGKLAATVFTGGCNLRCPFCHNALLVTRLNETHSIPQDEVLGFLSTRVKLLDGVVLTGGEPLVHPDAAEFLQSVRDLGFAVKLDTNGFFPQRLQEILQAKLVDYVAIDIKNSPEKYPFTCGVPNLDLTPLQESIQLLRTSGVDYEFRTTAVRELHTCEDFEAIGQWIKGSPHYYIQNFVDSGNLIESGYHGFEAQELQTFAQVVHPFLPTVSLRGI